MQGKGRNRADETWGTWRTGQGQGGRPSSVLYSPGVGVERAGRPELRRGTKTPRDGGEVTKTDQAGLRKRRGPGCLSEAESFWV